MQFKSIVCFGEALWDMLPQGAQPGGAPMNVAIHLKKQGINPWLVSRIGKDGLGKDLEQFLLNSGLDLLYLQRDDLLPSGKVKVHLDVNKNALYEICEPAAWDNIQLTGNLIKLAAKADLIVFGSLASRNETTRKTLLHLLGNTRALKLLDVNLRPPFNKRDLVEPLLFRAEFIKMNEEELEEIAKWNDMSGSETELVRRLSVYYSCPYICITRGAKGALFWFRGQIVQHQGFNVKAVDTVGAGDGFLAALIAKLSEQYPVEKALEFACATGAFIASQSGAVPSYSKNNIECLIG